MIQASTSFAILAHALAGAGTPSLVSPPTAAPHCTNHAYLFQTNGTIKIGRDMQAGGAITWISDETGGKFTGQNAVNNFGCGRQVQMAVWDGPAWNPTQAGTADGSLAFPSNNSLIAPSSCPGALYTQYPHPLNAADGYIYSKVTPQLFVNPCCVNPPPTQATCADGISFYMWTELLPDSGGRAVLVKTVFRIEANSPHMGLPDGSPGPNELYGRSTLQFVSPIAIVNMPKFWAPTATEVKGFFVSYDKTTPWIDDQLTAIEPIGANFSGGRRTSEQWSAFVVDNPDSGFGNSVPNQFDIGDWGLARHSNMSVSGWQVNDASNCEGSWENGVVKQNSGTACDPVCGASLPQDHLYDSWSITATERFQVATTQARQDRESRTVLYWGPIGEARAYFRDNLKPQKSGAFSDEFASTVDDPLYQWDKNSLDIAPKYDSEDHKTAIEMNPSPDLNVPPAPKWSQDLSLKDRYWGDATYTFSGRIVTPSSNPSSDYYGLAFRKAGDCHFEVVPPWGGVQGTGGPGSNTITAFYLLKVLGNDKVQLLDSDHLSTEPLASADLPTGTAQTWTKWKLEATGRVFTVSRLVGDSWVPVLTCSDGAEGSTEPFFEAGYVSLVASKSVTARFDDFDVDVPGGDSTPPTNPAFPNATVITNPWNQTGIRVNWTMPLGSIAPRWTRVVRKDGSVPPAHWRDGLCVYEGKRRGFFDIDVVSGQTYSYRILTLDAAGNYSSGVTVTKLFP